MHRAEIALQLFFQKAIAGETIMTEEVADKVASDVKAALYKQFDSGPRDAFRLRMSNIGKPKCQLWFEKNDPSDKIPLPPNFVMNMMIGDITEAVFKGVLRAAKVDFKDNDVVTLDLGDLGKIKGEYDMILDDKVDDVKSASPYSYDAKFESLDTLQKSDTFGYINQLVGYAKAAGKDVGGWWVINKATGHYKYVSAEDVDVDAVIENIKDTVDYITNDKPFERCFEPVPEYYRKSASGNTKLGTACGYCSFKLKCWPELKQLESRVSQAKIKPTVDYVHIGDDNG